MIGCGWQRQPLDREMIGRGCRQPPLNFGRWNFLLRIGLRLCYNELCGTEKYRSGHNGADSKSVGEQSHVGSNPTFSAK
jgi:hypothetical protein